MKNLFGILLVSVFALSMLFTDAAFAQRGSCNVQQSNQQTSAAAALERAQITAALQGQQLTAIRPQGVTSASAVANSGSVSPGPSVAALRAAAVPYVVQSQPYVVQSAPVVVQSQAVDPGTVLVAAAPVDSGRRHLFGGGLLPRTQTSKSVAITRTSSR